MDFFKIILSLSLYVYSIFDYLLYMLSFTTIIYCILIIYLFLFHTHNYINCYESAQVHPATAVLEHTLVTLRNKGRYEGAQIHPVFRTGAQRAL